jgi:hypothetical protein
VSQEKIQRRRFLADILFAGGALSAAALAAKAWNQPQVTSALPSATPDAPTPLAPVTPPVTNHPLPQNNTMLSGEVAPPMHPAGAPMPPRMQQTPKFEKPASNP